MRSSGVLASPSASPHSHICSVFDGEAAFRDAAVDFLGAGVKQGERLIYSVDRPSVEALRDDLDDLDDVDTLVDDGALLLRPLFEVYGSPDGFDVERQTETYRKAIAEAVDDGYSGLRVAADASGLATTETHRRRMLQYEMEVDRTMAELPMVALCGYDRTRLGDAALDFCAVHPESVSSGTDPAMLGFRFFYDGGRLCLAGEIDLASRPLLPAALDVVAATGDAELVLDVAGLEFVDAAGMSALDRLAHEVLSTGRTMRVEGASATVRRCCEILGLDALESTMAEAAA